MATNDKTPTPAAQMALALSKAVRSLIAKDNRWRKINGSTPNATLIAECIRALNSYHSSLANSDRAADATATALLASGVLE